jgi:hypothetical protein
MLHARTSLSLLAFFLSMRAELWACSCLGHPSPGDAYSGSLAVFIGSVKTVEPAPSDDEDKNTYSEQTVKIRIEQVFKGPKVDEITVHQPGHNCAPKFRPGQRWLLYPSYHEQTGTWEVGGCGRSTRLDRSGDAADDMLFLNALPDSAATTRLSGTLKHYEDDPQSGFSLIQRIAGVRVRIHGEDRTYEAYTNKDGVYELYGLPPGWYTIDPELPAGFKIRFDMMFGWRIGRTEDKKPRVELARPGNTGVDFILSSATHIRGRVIGPDGKPLVGVCVDAIPADGPAGRSFREFDCTDASGLYKIEGLAPARYLLVANRDGRITGSEPFPSTYYPSVFEREDAAVVTVVHGEPHDHQDIRIPTLLRTVEIEGRLTFSDGRAVSKESVSFRSAQEGDPEASVLTDTAGRFRLQVIHGSVGWLSGKTYVYASRFTDCPEVDKLLASSPGKQFLELSTPAIKLQMGEDIRGVELRFPFPFCAEAKKP